jgi:hypothetical protein
MMNEVCDARVLGCWLEVVSIMLLGLECSWIGVMI